MDLNLQSPKHAILDALDQISKLGEFPVRVKYQASTIRFYESSLFPIDKSFRAENIDLA